jgi:archaeal flagellar protein FlaJ
MSTTKVNTLNEVMKRLTSKNKAKISAKEAFNFKDKSAFNFDMLYQLSCMSVISASGVPRKVIFEYAAKLPCSSAGYFRKINLTSERLRYDYAKSCRLVGEQTKEEKMRELLLRFSSSLLSGEPEAIFLEREAKSIAEDYDNEYNRKIESLKLWSDAYVSLVLSAVLVIIMGIISTMIWKVEFSFLVGLVAISTGTAGMGVFLLRLMAPKEKMVLGWAGSKEQKQAAVLFKIMVPTAAVVASLVVMVGMNFGWALILIAACVFPLGYIMDKDDQKIAKRDIEIGTFLATLGGISGAIGTTVKDALGRIDIEAINSLRNEVKKLYVRLKSGILPKLCWSKFVEETGSELIHRSIDMFYGSIELGGDVEQIGHHASLFATRIGMLRAKRKSVAIPFRWLCITMHAAVVSLMIFVSEVISIFGSMVAKAEAAMPAGNSGVGGISAFTSFNIQGMTILHSLVVPLVIIFTVADSLAPFMVEGGSWMKILYNLGIMSAISGIALISLPQIATILFSSVKM